MCMRTSQGWTEGEGGGNSLLSKGARCGAQSPDPGKNVLIFIFLVTLKYIIQYC